MRPAADRMPAGGTAVASVQPWRWPAALVALAALALAAGGVPLSVLERIVDGWVATQA